MTRRPEPGAGAGGDAVVILCRGDSLRFGGPKALARVGPDARPLLRRVAELYAGCLDAPVLVVATDELREACAACVAGLPAVRVVSAPGGGDTARTLGLAWEHLRGSVPGCRRVWAHPVDLPRVGARTIAQLANLAIARPARVVRPAWGGRPGHPVVIPAALLATLAAEARAWGGPWREVLARAVADGRAEPPFVVAVADPGVVLDHDEPDGAG